MYQRINDVAVQIKSKADKEWGIEKAKITQELNELLLKNRKNNEQEKDNLTIIQTAAEQINYHFKKGDLKNVRFY